MKTFIFLVASVLITSFLIFGCDFNVGSDGKVVGIYLVDDTGLSSGTEVSCPDLVTNKDCKASGVTCCSEDDKCSDFCSDSFDGTAESNCQDLSEATGEKMRKFVENNLKNPDYDDVLRKLETSDYELFCTMLNKLDVSVWVEQIDDGNFSTSDAQQSIEWVVRTGQVTNIISQLEEEQREELLTLLLQSLAGSETSDANLLEGLTAKRVGSSNSVLDLAVDSDNKTLIRIFHRKIVEETLCENSNRPVPASTNKEASERDEEACVLAVYCHKASSFDDDDAEKLRKKLAKILGINGVENLIKDPIADGGLGLDEKDAANDWNNQACSELKKQWKNGSLILGLGLRN